MLPIRQKSVSGVSFRSFFKHKSKSSFRAGGREEERKLEDRRKSEIVAVFFYMRRYCFDQTNENSCLSKSKRNHSR